MRYPTIDEVNSADHTQICKWARFLDSPGIFAIGRDDFDEILEREVAIMNRVCERLKEFGGFTPEISKALGWRPIPQD